VNDHDFRYCQLCGYQRKVVSIQEVFPTVDFNLHEIDARLQQLWDFDRATKYAKQKDSLQKELEVFLCALPGHITLETVTPRDLCRFLVFKDRHGKTQIHSLHCPFLGQRGKQVCVVHSAYLIKLLIPILANFVLF
jgi:hypothetical protein